MDSILHRFADPTTAAVFFGVLLICWALYPKRKYRLPPGPYNWPIIGCTIGMLWNKHGNKQYLQFMDWSKRYGSIFFMDTILGKMVVLNDIKVVTEAVVNKSKETAGRIYYYTVGEFTDGGRDIVFMDYSEHVKYMRKIAGSALRNLLSGNKLETITHMSISKGLDVFEEKARTKEAFNPKHHLSILVHNFLCRLCFDVDLDLEDPDFKALYRLYTEGLPALTAGYHLVDVFPPARFLPPTQSMKLIRDITEGVNTAVMRFMNEHQKTYDPDHLRDFVDHLIKVKMETKDDGGNTKRIVLETVHYKEIIVDIFRAGTDTTSNTLLFIVYLLTHYPMVEKKVQEEIDRVVGTSRLPGEADKHNMPYCEAVMYECMRYGTIVPLGIPHKAMCDVELGGYEIPKDTVIMINHFALHRDPNEWKNPEEFDPDRFLDVDGKLLPRPPSFLPFGAGTRVCLGEAIAKPEIFMIYTAIYQKFSFRFEKGCGEEMKFDDSMLVFVPEPYKVVAELRT